MNADFIKSPIPALAIMAALVGAEQLPRYLPDTYVSHHFDKVVAMLRNGELNSDDVHALTASYYEGLEDTVRIANGPENEDYHVLPGFLRYEFKPNLKRPYPAGMRITNSLGMPNPEYGYVKPAGVRRIALIGDSLSIGPWGHDYERLLENRLNERDRPSGVSAFQILNFSVPGYSGVQMMDVVREKTPRFEPDVCLIGLSGQEMSGASLRHMARLIQKSTDLKYRYLKDVAAEAHVESTDRRPAMAEKLQPFFMPVTRWAQREIVDFAKERKVGVIFVLVPAVVAANVTAADFDALHSVVDPLGAPVIDLRDTFRNADLKSLQVVADQDIHPNGRGHEIILEALYSQLRAQPRAWEMLVGGTH